MPEAMRRLAAAADLVLPNATEAALLLGRPYAEPAGPEDAKALADAVRQALGCKNAVVTGMPIGRYLYCAGAGEEAFVCRQLHAGRSFPGTGDLFASGMLGALLNGATLADACERAGEVVKDCIAYTAQQGTDPLYGVQFEKLLGELIGRK